MQVTVLLSRLLVLALAVLLMFQFPVTDSGRAGFSVHSRWWGPGFPAQLQTDLGICVRLSFRMAR